MELKFLLLLGQMKLGTAGGMFQTNAETLISLFNHFAISISAKETFFTCFDSSSSPALSVASQQCRGDAKDAELALLTFTLLRTY